MIDYALTSGWFHTPAGTPVRMRFREGTNDWNTLASCLNEDEYAIPRGRSGVAVDIGAYLGGVAIAYAIDNPDAKVYAIEPVPPNVELLRANIELNGLGDRITVIEGAVGKGEVAVWYGYRGNASAEHHAFVGNSTLAYDHGGELAHEEVRYTAITLGDLHDRVGAIDWMKIDTEGGEWSFLDDDVSAVRFITGEWHPVRGHVQRDVLTLLGGTHDVTFSGPEHGPGGFVAVRR